MRWAGGTSQRTASNEAWDSAGEQDSPPPGRPERDGGSAGEPFEGSKGCSGLEWGGLRGRGSVSSGGYAEACFAISQETARTFSRPVASMLMDSFC